MFFAGVKSKLPTLNVGLRFHSHILYGHADRPEILFKKIFCLWKYTVKKLKHYKFFTALVFKFFLL